jgi:hypothetical protein
MAGRSPGHFVGGGGSLTLARLVRKWAIYCFFIDPNNENTCPSLWRRKGRG